MDGFIMNKYDDLGIPLFQETSRNSHNSHIAKTPEVSGMLAFLALWVPASTQFSAPPKCPWKIRRVPTSPQVAPHPSFHVTVLVRLNAWTWLDYVGLFGWVMLSPLWSPVSCEASVILKLSRAWKSSAQRKRILSDLHSWSATGGVCLGSRTNPSPWLFSTKLQNFGMQGEQNRDHELN